ncbi:MAG: M16 family metallopeptidase [Myxococcota bacterium]
MSPRAKGRDVRFETPEGAIVMLEESHELPMVDVEVVLRTGAAHDPRDREGLARLTFALARMGTGAMGRAEVEETLARLGGRLSVETGTSFVRFRATVIRRNLEPFVELLAALVREPAMRAKDLAHLKRETASDLVAARDNDRSLGARGFRRLLYGDDHPYGRSIAGRRASIRAIRRADVVRHHRAHLVGPNLILGAAGDVTRAELERLVARHFGGLSKRRPPRDEVRAPKRPRGRRVLIVDKPERTQTQLFIGTLGSRVHDADLYPLTVANTAFGGTFTARLMNEVRSKRGWSYGAYSRLGQDRQRDAWYMWTFPAAKDAAACARLELELLEQLLQGGLSAAEVKFAKDNLINGHCFEIDTPSKRMEARIDCEVYGLPPDHWRRFTKLVRGVKRADANAALKKRLSARDLAIAVVATADDVRADFEALPGVSSIEVLPYDKLD